jgi:hypothetical protein
MSGFLRRLAAQTLGHTTPVRSTARLPYGKPTPFAAIATETGEQPVWLLQHPNGMAPGRAPPAAEAAAESRREMPDGAAAQPTLASESASRRPTSAHPAAIRVRQPVPTPQIEQRSDTVRRSGDLRAASLPQRQIEAEIVRQGDQAVRDRAEAATQTTAADRRNTPPARRPAPPPPLLKPAPFDAARQQRLPPQPAAPRAGTVEETTEVHVSIGRIEVTAVHEAAPPRRSAPRATKPMGLDEYLARRGSSR